jgi:hypothetical protein
MRFVAVLLLLGGCATARIPEAIKGYDVVIEGDDEQSVEFARALRAYGIRVRPQVRGGSGQTAALIFFTFRVPTPGEATWLHLRLADTRSGVIIRAGTIQLDSSVATPRSRALAGIQALMAGDSTLSSP